MCKNVVNSKLLVECMVNMFGSIPKALIGSACLCSLFSVIGFLCYDLLVVWHVLALVLVSIHRNSMCTMASDLSDKCQHFRTRFSLAAAAVVGLGFWTLFAGSSLIWGQWFISSAMLRLGPLRHSATKLMRSMRWGHISSLVVFAISDLQSFPTVIPKSVQIIPYTYSLHTFWDGH